MRAAAVPIAVPWLATIRSSAPAWLPIWLGLAILYVPTLVGLARGHWASSDQAHGPMVLALALWMMWRAWPARAAGERASAAWGWALVVPGLCAYVVGRSQAILILEIGSALWLLAGFIAMQRGLRTLRAVWLAFFLLLFLLPMPGSVVAFFTLPMKLLVSHLVEALLYAAGYPVSRSGVLLQIGYYQLLVADACAGLQTVLTLEAMGLLYLNVVRHSSTLRNAVLALCIVPISISANVIRVLALVLITYYWGDDAGQGFLHAFAGLVLYGSALALVIGADSLLRLADRPHPSAAARAAP
jgi:exosortase B